MLRRGRRRRRPRSCPAVEKQAEGKRVESAVVAGHFQGSEQDRIVDAVGGDKRRRGRPAARVHRNADDFDSLGRVFAPTRWSNAISRRHGLHHVAQKFKTTTRPASCQDCNCTSSRRRRAGEAAEPGVVRRPPAPGEAEHGEKEPDGPASSIQESQIDCSGNLPRLWFSPASRHPRAG